MKGTNRAAAALLAAAMAASFAACSGDTSWVAKSGGRTMPAGVYIVNQIDAYYEAQDKYDQAHPDEDTAGIEEKERAKALMSAEVEGKTGSQFITDTMAQNVRRYFAVEQEFETLGLSLSESDEALASGNTEMIWSYSSAFYEKNGISKDSLDLTTRNYLKQNLLMSSLYGPGGEREIPEADYESYFKETRARVRYIPFSLTDESLQALPEEEAKKVEEKANAYFERAKAGEDMLALVAEYQKESTGNDLPDATPGAYDALITKDSTSPSKAFVDEMLTAPENEVRLIKDEKLIFVAVRIDTMFSRDDYENAKNTMLTELKQDEFEAWLDEKAGAMEITFNDAALRRYTPEKIKFD